MVTVDELLKTQGDVRRVIALPHGVVDWSDRREWLRLEVLRNLEFNDFRVSNVDVGLDFIFCEFSNCLFEGLRVENHFFGSGDVWQSCVFEGCEMSGMIAPMNSFRDCRFDNLRLQNFKPYQTLFTGTVFENCSIQGLKAQIIRNNRMVNADMASSLGQLLFRDCSFVDVEFRQCYFQDVIFEQCKWERTTADECSFEGVVSDLKWWQTQRVDPFTAFLSDALELIRRKCGLESAAYKEFENYLIDYGAGRTSSRDFSACLYNNRVPYPETQKIIKDLRKLVDSHPF